MKLIIFFFVCCSLTLISKPFPSQDTYKDIRDGRTYSIVEMAGLEWFAQNLNYRSEGSICFNDHPFNCRRMGRLYTWHQAIIACPEGWRLPTDSDWNKLYQHYGNSIDAYNGLTKGLFTASLSGWQGINGGFHHVGKRGYYWSASEKNDGYARYYRFSKKNNSFNSDNSDKEAGFSCRCVRDK